jgi:hypothetical protein
MFWMRSKQIVVTGGFDQGESLVLIIVIKNLCFENICFENIWR